MCVDFSIYFIISTSIHRTHVVVGLLPNISSDPEILAQVLSYHVLPGTFNVTDTPSFPNTTVARTLFNSSSLVFLEGGRSQALAWSNSSDGVTILNQECVFFI